MTPGLVVFSLLWLAGVALWLVYAFQSINAEAREQIDAIHLDREVRECGLAAVIRRRWRVL